MILLGIETSCDETAAGIIEADNTTQKLTLRSNIIASSLHLHAKTGGIIPEAAAREQLKYITPVITEALKQGLRYQDERNTIPPIDAIAVTYGPGLVGSLLVGIETAKTLSYLWQKPLIPVNHMLGHIYANFICENSKLHPSADGPNSKPKIVFPAVVLVVSGGHTDLLLMKSHADITVLGGTRDDAAGEAFDKIGRLLGLPYPAGPAIERLAQAGDPKAFSFPRPLHNSHDFDFSFSGLKTAVLREVQKQPQLTDTVIKNIARGTQDAIIDVLVTKTLSAVKHFGAQSVLLSGGVAANETLRTQLRKKADDQRLTTNLFAPPKNLCTDNGAMIAAAGYFHNNPLPWQNVSVNPQLYY